MSEYNQVSKQENVCWVLKMKDENGSLATLYLLLLLLLHNLKFYFDVFYFIDSTLFGPNKVKTLDSVYLYTGYRNNTKP